jgi:glycosyltransferase involved in cell wall biosynthesis
MVVSQTLRKYYADRYGAQTIYVPNGTVLRERATPSQILQWGLGPDDYILFLGRLSPEKNCHLLIEAYEMLDTPMKLVFAGGSSHTDTYASTLRIHQSDKIRFLDWVSGDALEELITNAALFVLPSDLEGLSLALLDAMGAGVCVLTSDIPENREVVHGVGHTFAPGDVNDLSRKLHLLLCDRDARQAAGRNAQDRVRQQYLWPVIANQVSNEYRQLAGKPEAQASFPIISTAEQLGQADKSA